MKLRAILFLFSLTTALAQVIPSTNRIDWSTYGIGVPGGPKARNAVIRNVVTDGGGDATGATDVSAAVQGLINACSSNDVVYFPAGKFKLTSTISLGTRSITLRGAGMTNTEIIDGITGSTPTGLINVGLNNPGADVNITATANRGDTTITVASASGFAVGQMCVIAQANDTNIVWHSLGTDRVLRQVCRITSVSGTTIGIDPPLFWTFSLAPRVHLLPSVNYYAGFENLTITHSNTLTSALGTCGSAIFFDQCYGAWITNCEFSWAKNRHIYNLDSMRATFWGNYIHEAQGYGPDQGVGIEGFENLQFALIENNIFIRCFPSVMLSTASSGNVLIYNFSDDVQTGSSLIGGDLNGNHGPHNMFNLWEGNIGCMFQSDGYFGSCSHPTVFRNFLKGVHPSLTDNVKCVSLERGTYWANIVGNILGHPSIPSGSWTYTTTANAYPYTDHIIIRTGYPHTGNNGYDEPTLFPTDPDGFDPQVAARATIEGNYDYKNLAQIWSGAPQTLVDSYYYGAKPDYFGTLSFPPFDPAHPSTNFLVIPAAVRYYTGADPSGGEEGGGGGSGGTGGAGVGKMVLRRGGLRR